MGMASPSGADRQQIVNAALPLEKGIVVFYASRTIDQADS
jgi:hypothetical protein